MTRVGEISEVVQFKKVEFWGVTRNLPQAHSGADLLFW
jgi:hypothetical protein